MYLAQPSYPQSSTTQEDLDQYYSQFRGRELSAPQQPVYQPTEEEQKQNLVQNFNPQTRECLLGLHLLDPQMVDQRPRANFL